MVGIEMALIRIEMGISDDQTSQTASVGKQGIQGGMPYMQDQGRV